MASNAELTAKTAELEARLAKLTAQAEAADKRAADAEARAANAVKPTHSGISLKVSENAKCVSIYGLQTRPVTLYASQFVKLFGHEAEIKAFILANADALAWKTPDERTAALARIRPAVVPVEVVPPTA